MPCLACTLWLFPQVSSYGGHLRYELHSDARRGDVFVPMESRPDVILKVQPVKPRLPCAMVSTA